MPCSAAVYLAIVAVPRPRGGLPGTRMVAQRLPPSAGSRPSGLTCLTLLGWWPARLLGQRMSV